MVSAIPRPMIVSRNTDEIVKTNVMTIDVDELGRLERVDVVA